MPQRVWGHLLLQSPPKAHQSAFNTWHYFAFSPVSNGGVFYCFVEDDGMVAWCELLIRLGLKAAKL